MQMAKMYIDKKYLSEKLGIDEDKMFITSVNGSIDSIEFMLVVEDDVEVDTINTTNSKDMIDSFGNIRRQKLK